MVLVVVHPQALPPLFDALPQQTVVQAVVEAKHLGGLAHDQRPVDVGLPQITQPPVVRL